MTKEQVKAAVKELKEKQDKLPEVKPLDGQRLKEAWGRMGLDVAFPAISRRIDSLCDTIDDLTLRLKEAETNYILTKARLEGLEDWKYSHMETMKTTDAFIAAVKGTLGEKGEE